MFYVQEIQYVGFAWLPGGTLSHACDVVRPRRNYRGANFCQFD